MFLPEGRGVVWAEWTEGAKDGKALDTVEVRSIRGYVEQEEEQSKEEGRKKLMENQRRER
ncbi:hypothetical protein ABD07_07205 [Nitrosomonas oligotropha]|nr:hypothetical protein [Nitrosomonas oligotropha]